MSNPTEPVIGVRRWRVTKSGWLASYALDVLWRDGPQEATCNSTSFTSFTTIQPTRQCTCYRYALNRAANSLKTLASTRLTSMKLTTSPTGHLIPRPLPPNEPVSPPVSTRMTCPTMHGSCGFWAHSRPIPDCDCGDDTRHHGAVGIIRMWGDAVQHTDGTRSQFAQIVALVDHTGRAQEARRYNVPYYPSTADMYAEWMPDQVGTWSREHDTTWCTSEPWPMQSSSISVTYQEIERVVGTLADRPINVEMSVADTEVVFTVITENGDVHTIRKQKRALDAPAMEFNRSA